MKLLYGHFRVQHVYDRAFVPANDMGSVDGYQD